MARPSIDHSLLSPSGRMSRRARKAAMHVETARLFPPGYWDKPAKTPEEEAAETKASDLRYAAELRRLAACGMHPRKYPRIAAAIEAKYRLTLGRGT